MRITQVTLILSKVNEYYDFLVHNYTQSTTTIVDQNVVRYGVQIRVPPAFFSYFTKCLDCKRGSVIWPLFAGPGPSSPLPQLPSLPLSVPTLERTPEEAPRALLGLAVGKGKWLSQPPPQSPTF